MIIVALPKLMQGQCSDVYDTMSAEGCNHYEWQGRVLTTSGNYDDTVANAVAGGCDSLLTLRLTIYRCITPPNPDNMDSSQCVKMLDAREWSIQNSWSSGGGVSNHNTPMVGDLDDDGVPDIMCFGSSGEHDNNGLRDCTVLVYDGITKRQKANFRMPVYVTAYDAGAYGLVKLPSRKGLIIMAGIDCYLRAFDITSANPATPYWTSNEPYGTGNQFAVNVSFADFNNDGHPEIVVRNKIFDAATGVLLATTTGGNNTGASYAHYSHRTGRTLYSPMVANLLGDDRQELILGNEIYDIRITNRSGTAGNSATLIKRINPPTSVVQDGHAQVADFNLDGHLDIFVSNKDVVGGGGTVSMYVWDVHNNRTSPAVRIPCNMSGKSLPLIANIDTDDNLEVTIQCAASGVGNQRVRTYKYNAASNQFDFMWGIGVDEDSYSNGMTAFDFNLDGVNEMLICDQSTMRVVNGAGQVMNSFRFSETTIMQYPVIADVDCDGHAEVVSVGSGRLNIFKSSGQPWAPARSVWNQYMYNITCVNNDLTVPRYYYFLIGARRFVPIRGPPQIAV
ncbi:MAG: VCBS repeat-containing protein [Bacteroidales bacterium]|nr:VCBS repeat-containing protein [Bacteroidales bacterium]